jgi:hypothetical protein
MLERIEDSSFTMGTHIVFRNLGQLNGSRGYQRKTNVYDVLTKDNIKLGEIRWFGRWRKYCFYPWNETLYEETCMREISQFIEEETSAQRKAAAAKRKAAKA